MAMAECAVRNYKVFNPDREDCPVSRMFSSLYQADSFLHEQAMPERLGSGYCQRHVVSPLVEIFVSDLTFYEKITMREEIRLSPYYGLAFCLADPLHWWMGDGREYEIGRGESCVFNGISGDSACTYEAGMRFYGVSLRYAPDTIADLAAHMGRGAGGGLRMRKISPGVRLILHDILRCRYCGGIRSLYLEGKALELLAVYLDELVLENGKPDSLPKLSPADVDALHRARRILDGNVISPPTIGRLSRMACLNEYKLKAGFRELFGMPVHAYVIDKRLELARSLLAERNLSVTEAALLVGYSNASHFAEKFREKYGVRPSEHRRLL